MGSRDWWIKLVFEDLDRDCGHLSLATRGAWVWMIGHLHRNYGESSLTLEGWARVIRSSLTQTAAVLEEIIGNNVCDADVDGEKLINCKEHITIRCRRMVRELGKRRAGAARAKAFRERGGGDPQRWTAIRVHILERDEYRCAYCNRRATTVDHVVPRAKGGNEENSNLVACCRKCNFTKGTRTLEESGLRFRNDFDSSHLYGSNIAVTQQSQQSNRVELEVSSYTPHSPPGNGDGKAPTEEDYVALWEAYPAHRRKSLNLIFEALRPYHPTRELVGKMLAAIALLKDSDQWRERNGQFVPSITNWIGSRGWESVPADGNDLRPEPAGSDPAPPKGTRWKRDASGELIHPLMAEPI